MNSRVMKVILATSLVASLSVADDSIILKEMKHMRDGMNQINDGFFYGKKDKMIDGLNSLRDANNIFNTQDDVKKYLPAKVKHMSGMSFNTARKINKNIDKMKKSINKNNFAKASAIYSDIMSSCISCHATVRGLANK